MTYCAACRGHGTNVHDPDCPVTDHVQTIRRTLEAAWEVPDRDGALAALDALVAREARYRTALERAAETFEDFALTLPLLGHPTAANAARIAGEHTRAALAGADQKEAARERAVRIVDERHGYTAEHAPNPAAHRAEYDAEEAGARD